jgi:methylenetetrahydrofolate dehydrogenase (NADP+)/methenyltetrahydrofolate cyclohydrolase
MSTQLLDGKQIAERVLRELKPRVDALRSRAIEPRLAVVRVGDDAASKVYVRGKIRACETLGIRGDSIELPSSTSHAQLAARIAALNADVNVHGILVQLPLPAGLDAHAIAGCIDPRKDVDGFHAQNLGRLLQGGAPFLPCTPAGVIRLLDAYAINLRGAHAVVIGRSEIVGKPMALLLIERDATVTVCHSKTRRLAVHTRDADIVVVAAGRAGLLTGDMISSDATVVDIGINRLPDGRLVGDVDAATVTGKARFLSPVPGGVGPMTVAMLIENTVKAAERLAPVAREDAASAK